MEKSFCKNLGGFLEVSLVSWRVIIAGLCFWIIVCREGKDVLRLAIFQDIREARVEAHVGLWICGGGWSGGGGGGM